MPKMEGSISKFKDEWSVSELKERSVSIQNSKIAVFFFFFFFLFLFFFFLFFFVLVVDFFVVVVYFQIQRWDGRLLNSKKEGINSIFKDGNYVFPNSN